MKKVKKLSKVLIHPFLLGLLGDMIVSSYLHNPSMWKFYLLSTCFLLVLPKILIEFFLGADHIFTNGLSGFVRVSIYYIIFMIFSDQLLFNQNNFFLGSLSRPIIFIIMFKLGMNYTNKYSDKISK